MSSLVVKIHGMNVSFVAKSSVGVWCVGLIVLSLSVLGCVYLSRCASVTAQPINLEEFRLNRQLAWNGIGLSLAVMLQLAGWRRVLSAAPFVLVAWLALLAIGLFYHNTSGSLRVPLGFVQVDVMAYSPLVGVVSVTWLADQLARKFNVRACMVVGIALIVIATFGAAMTLISADAGERQDMDARVQQRLGAQRMCVEAFNAAHWLSGNKAATRSVKLPVRYAFTMPPNSALMFGSWFPGLVAGLFGALACALVCCWRKARSEAVKVLVFFSGFNLLIPAALGFCGCLGLTPWPYIGVPLVSYGSAAVVSSWLQLGALVAAERQKEVL